MDYFRWKRRIDACGMLLLLFQPVLWLILADGMVQYRQENYIPVEIKYPLSEVPEDQAVLVQTNSIKGISYVERIYDLVVNKEGRWKLIDYSETDVSKLYAQELEYGFYDAVLRDDRIPWQKKKIAMNSVLLERAMNMPNVKFKRGSSANLSSYKTDKRYIGLTYGYLLDNSLERQRIYYSVGVSKKCDYAVLYMQYKMKEIASSGYKARKK